MNKSVRLLLAAVVLLGAVALGAWVWAGPRDEVAVPGPGASPEEVVRAYLAAIEARDFDTANEIDARSDQDLGRFSRPIQITNLSNVKQVADTGGRVDVSFLCDISRADASMQEGRQQWGYVLERGKDHRWHIVDEGVG